VYTLGASPLNSAAAAFRISFRYLLLGGGFLTTVGDRNATAFMP
jgi:hypothetical protein